MKKLLCIILSVLMILSTCSAFAFAANGYAAVNNISSYNSFDGLMAQKDKLIYGYSVDDLYNGSGSVDWGKLDITYVSNGKTVKMDKGAFALAKADVNSYVRRLVNHVFAGERMFTENYATKLSNFIGKIINPAYQEKTVKFPSSEIPNEDEFFEIVANESGLTALIQTNWIDRGVNFLSVLHAFDVAIDGIPENRFEKAYAMATVLLKSAVRKFLDEGPINFVFDIIWDFSRSLNEKDFFEAVSSLMTLKVNALGISVDELRTIEGLYQAAFGNIYSYKLVKFPASRVATAADMTELQLYLLMYFALNYKYAGNTAIVDGLPAKFNRITFDGRYNGGELSVIRANMAKFIDCGLKGNISYDSINVINALNKENFDEAGDDFWVQISNSFTKILRKIADYFKYLAKLFTGEIKFGENLLK